MFPMLNVAPFWHDFNSLLYNCRFTDYNCKLLHYIVFFPLFSSLLFFSVGDYHPTHSLARPLVHYFIHFHSLSVKNWYIFVSTHFFGIGALCFCAYFFFLGNNRYTKISMNVIWLVWTGPKWGSISFILKIIVTVCFQWLPAQFKHPFREGEVLDPPPYWLYNIRKSPDRFTAHRVRREL